MYKKELGNPISLMASSNIVNTLSPISEISRKVMYCP